MESIYRVFDEYSELTLEYRTAPAGTAAVHVLADWVQDQDPCHGRLDDDPDIYDEYLIIDEDAYASAIYSNTQVGAMVLGQRTA